ncbi:hypothetical protein DJ523_07720 [Sulfolobus sp. E5]|nr:hypothetical protein DJ523_07720 [Sulfolobus sp. E5]
MTNDQAQGYVLLTCKELGITREIAEQLIYAMESQFDYYAEQEAKEKGFNWLYDRENLNTEY